MDQNVNLIHKDRAFIFVVVWIYSIATMVFPAIAASTDGSSAKQSLQRRDANTEILQEVGIGRSAVLEALIEDIHNWKEARCNEKDDIFSFSRPVCDPVDGASSSMLCRTKVTCQPNGL